MSLFKNYFSLIFIASAFYCGQTALAERTQQEQVVFTMADEGGNRITILLSGDSSHPELYMRYYQDHNILLLEQPLEGKISMEGRVTPLFQTWQLEPEPLAKTGEMDESQMGDSTNGTRHAPLRTLFNPKSITDNTTTSVPPTGPPPANGGN